LRAPGFGERNDVSASVSHTEETRDVARIPETHLSPQARDDEQIDNDGCEGGNP
jgi:hypothetical protein